MSSYFPLRLTLRAAHPRQSPATGTPEDSLTSRRSQISNGFPYHARRESALRVLHLASFHRWTGAAAVALSEVEALRLAGIEAHFAFVGGSNLQSRLAADPLAHPLLRKRHDPLTLLRDARAIRTLLRKERIELLHAHLSYDHIAALIGRPSSIPLVRTFHAARPLRRDPFTRMLLRRTEGLCVVNDAMKSREALAGRSVATTPPPLDTTLFRPDGGSARSQLGLTGDQPVIGYIGKMTPGRGFEEAMETFAAFRRRYPTSRMLIIGRGPHRAKLEELAAGLGIADATIWAGYQEGEALVQRLRAANLMLFTALGSDQGHRAIIESLGCGTPVAAFPLPGVAELMGPLAPELVADRSDPESLAERAATILESASSFSKGAVELARAFSYEAAADRLIAVYRKLI
jgi:glycosyltransferase involved in cell wall biosynthesis